MEGFFKGFTDEELALFPKDQLEQVIGRKHQIVRTGLSYLREELLRSDESFRTYVESLNEKTLFDTFYTWKVLVHVPDQISTRSRFWEEVTIIDFKYVAKMQKFKAHQLESLDLSDDPSVDYFLIPSNVSRAEVGKFLDEFLETEDQKLTNYKDMTKEEAIRFGKMNQLVNEGMGPLPAAKTFIELKEYSDVRKLRDNYLTLTNNISSIISPNQF